MLLDGGVLKEREQRAALGCCDAPPLPVLRFGIGSRHFQRAEVTGGCLATGRAAEHRAFPRVRGVVGWWEMPCEELGSLLLSWPGSPGSCSTPVAGPVLLLTRDVT